MDFSTIVMALLVICVALLLKNRIFSPTHEGPSPSHHQASSASARKRVYEDEATPLLQEDNSSTVRQRKAPSSEQEQEEHPHHEKKREAERTPAKEKKEFTESVKKQDEHVPARIPQEEPALQKEVGEELVPQKEHPAAAAEKEERKEERQREVPAEKHEPQVPDVAEEKEPKASEDKEEQVEDEGGLDVDVEDEEEDEDDFEENDEEEDEDADLTEVQYSEERARSVGGVPRLVAACVSLQGMRPNNEDRFVINTVVTSKTVSPAAVFAVFDGHDGPAASIFCSKNLVNAIKANKKFPSDPKAALEQVYIKLDRKFLDKVEDGGSTAAVALITADSKLYVANAGDSRCVASLKGRGVGLTEDHKPDLPREKERIEAANHEVQYTTEVVQGKRTKIARVDGKLAVSRAIGDADFKDNPSAEPANQAVTAKPDIKDVNITADCEFLVLACDGLFDVMTNQEVVEYLSPRLESVSTTEQLEGVAKDLVQHAVSDLGSADNVTAVIVKFVH